MTGFRCDQLVGQERISLLLTLLGFGSYVAFVLAGMANIFLLLGLIALFAWVVALFDRWARHRDDQAHLPSHH
jgi:hypothetical protein